MKILSLNLQINSPNLQRVIDLLNSEAFDHVFFQEVTIRGSNDDAEHINRQLEHPFHSVCTDMVETYTTSRGDTYTQGMSVLSRDDIAQREPMLLHNVQGDKHERVAQFVTMQSRKSSVPALSFVNVHFANKPDNGTQLEQVLNCAGQDSNLPIILGDFNMSKTNLHATRQLWNNRYESSLDFADYISYPGSQEFSQIDVCLLPRTMRFLRIRTFEGLSDHNAVMYEIDAEDER